MGYVYILECNDGTFYVGSTTDVSRRLHQHNTAKNGAHYTKIRRPVVLRYSEVLSTLGEARSREAALKKLSRSQKQSLILKTVD
ncbi:GIY-YIG nuclease family protein [Patescibacteria group bacterium]|nr:GIY-YIG nuclease family protein [Patescibacteria group bacterium]